MGSGKLRLRTDGVRIRHRINDNTRIMLQRAAEHGTVGMVLTVNGYRKDTICMVVIRHW